MKPIFLLRVAFSFWTLLICISQLTAQEAYGLKFGAYVGTDQIFLNPSFSQSSAFSWEVNIASAHASFYTDYAFLRKANLFTLANALENVEVLTRQSQVAENPSSSAIIFDEDGGDKILNGNFRLAGPGVIVGFGGKHKAGIFANIRGDFSSTKIPEGFGVYELNNAFFDRNIDFRNVDIAGLIWREYGLHYSIGLENIDFGVNLKMLQAYEAAYLNSNSTLVLDYQDGKVEVPSGSIDSGFGFTRLGVYSQNFDILNSADYGTGYSIDIGGQMYFENFKIGLSIVDLGFLNIFHHLNHYRLPSNYSDFNITGEDYIDITTLDELIDQLEEDSPLEPYENHKGFTMGTPSSFILSADVKINQEFHVSGAISQRIRLFDIGGSRANNIVIVPRYQTKWISAHLPISYYEYKKINVGAALRLGFLTIGSDNLASVFRNTDFRGSDVYMKLSVSPIFNFRRNKSTKSKISKSNAKCYQF